MNILEDASSSFAAAHGSLGENEESVFYHRVANMIPEIVDVDNLILALHIALNEEERKGKNVVPFIALIPRYIEQFATPEFCLEFREKYNRLVLGLVMQDGISNEVYPINEIDEDIIDISKKSLGAVLAALYNASTPIGAGFIQYNPVGWNEQMASYYLEHQAQKNYDGYYVISYILGRNLDLYIKDNIINVKWYNIANGYKMGQKAIASVPDLVVDKDEKKKINKG